MRGSWRLLSGERLTAFRPLQSQQGRKLVPLEVLISRKGTSFVQGDKLFARSPVSTRRMGEESGCRGEGRNYVLMLARTGSAHAWPAGQRTFRSSTAMVIAEATPPRAVSVISGCHRAITWQSSTTEETPRTPRRSAGVIVCIYVWRRFQLKFLATAKIGSQVVGGLGVGAGRNIIESHRCTLNGFKKVVGDIRVKGISNEACSNRAMSGVLAAASGFYYFQMTSEVFISPVFFGRLGDDVDTFLLI
jgi:hypothetical protein